MARNPMGLILSSNAVRPTRGPMADIPVYALWVHGPERQISGARNRPWTIPVLLQLRAPEAPPRGTPQNKPQMDSNKAKLKHANLTTLL